MDLGTVAMTNEISDSESDQSVNWDEVAKSLEEQGLIEIHEEPDDNSMSLSESDGETEAERNT